MTRDLAGALGLTNNESPKTNGIDLSFLNDDSFQRKEQLKSIKLKIRELTPFVGNVRQSFDEENIESIKKSIEANGSISNIEVYHITKGDQFIIADGHTRHRAYQELYGDDFEVEVFVKGEYDELTQEVKKDLVKIGLLTSNTKKNLELYEQIHGVFDYIKLMDEIYPENAPHKVTSKNIYEAIGIKKSQAMYIGNILEAFSEDQIIEMKKSGVGSKGLKKISSLDTETLGLVYKVITSGNLGMTLNSLDNIDSIIDSVKEISNDEKKENEVDIDDEKNNKPVDKMLKVVSGQEVTQRMNEVNIKSEKNLIEEKDITSNTLEKVKEKISKKNMSPNNKLVKEVTTGVGKLTKAYMQILSIDLTPDEKSQIDKQMDYLKKFIKDLNKAGEK